MSLSVFSQRLKTCLFRRLGDSAIIYWGGLGGSAYCFIHSKLSVLMMIMTWQWRWMTLLILILEHSWQTPSVRYYANMMTTSLLKMCLAAKKDTGSSTSSMARSGLPPTRGQASRRSRRPPGRDHVAAVWATPVNRRAPTSNTQPAGEDTGEQRPRNDHNHNKDSDDDGDDDKAIKNKNGEVDLDENHRQQHQRHHRHRHCNNFYSRNLTGTVYSVVKFQAARNVTWTTWFHCFYIA